MGANNVKVGDLISYKVATYKDVRRYCVLRRIEGTQLWGAWLDTKEEAILHSNDSEDDYSLTYLEPNAKHDVIIEVRDKIENWKEEMHDGRN